MSTGVTKEMESMETQHKSSCRPGDASSSPGSRKSVPHRARVKAMMMMMMMMARLTLMLLSIAAATVTACTWNGKTVEGLSPGQVKQFGTGCANCTCFEDGGATCDMPACAKALCWDSTSEPFWCCATCPNGRNCKTSQGTIVNEGQHVIEDGLNCTCSDFTCGEGCDGPAASCVSLPTTTTTTTTTTTSTTTTTPSPTTTTTTTTTPATDTSTSSIVCLLGNGSLLEGVERPGDIWTSGDGCLNCTCESSGEVSCWNVSCTEPDCEDALSVEGRCCKVCPAELNICVLASRFHVPLDETVAMKNTTRCTCEKDDDMNLGLSCSTPTAGQLKREKGKIARMRKRIIKMRNTLHRLLSAITYIDY